MSVKLDYGTSEIIEQLPMSNDPLHPMDYAKIAPLLDEGSKLIHPLKRYIIAMALFLVCSLSILDGIILRFSPALANFGYIVLLIKSVIFGVLLYICDNALQDQKN
ncbi:MAG: hypothetical protein EB023_13160 [Flavobacteriia bacterium]|nr:hypothetical protein [Flavobacteriia bacterium]